MNRRNLLVKALSENLNKQGVESFFEYKLSPSDLSFIKHVLTHVLQNVEPRPFDCALLSAMITAAIQDNSNIPVALIGGDFKYKDLSIFKQGAENLNTEALNKNIINGKFDGHFWVEIGEFIIDASIFRSLYSSHLPEMLREEIKTRFDGRQGCIFATHSDLIEQTNFEYIPRYSLSENTINGIIKGGFVTNRLKK